MRRRRSCGDDEGDDDDDGEVTSMHLRLSVVAVR